MSGFVRMAGAADRIERNDGPHGGSVAVRLYFQPAVHFEQTLTHSGETDAGFRTRLAETLQTLGWYAASVISYFQNQIVGQALKTDANFRGPGVAVNVGQAFL